MALADSVSHDHLGQGVETEDPSNAYQCMDWAFFACDTMGIPREAIRHLYAFQVFTQPNDVTHQYFDIVPNSPLYAPPVNALAVWGQGVGSAGHIAWCLTGSTRSTLVTSDQNWNFKPYVQVVNHNYDNVLGFLVPKALSGGNEVDAAQIAEQRRVDLVNIGEAVSVYDGASHVQDIINNINTLQGKAADDDKVTQIAETRRVQLEDAQKQIDSLTSQVGDLQAQLQAARAANDLSGRLIQSLKTQIKQDTLTIQNLQAKPVPPQPSNSPQPPDPNTITITKDGLWAKIKSWLGL